MSDSFVTKCNVALTIEDPPNLTDTPVVTLTPTISLSVRTKDRDYASGG